MAELGSTRVYGVFHVTRDGWIGKDLSVDGSLTVSGDGIFAGIVRTDSTSLARGFKNTTISASAPSGGSNGDVWMQY